MDLAKEGKASIKINKRYITLLVNLPGIWLIYHLFVYGLNQKEMNFGVQFINHTDRTGQLFEEFQKYRNNIYFFYSILMIGVAFLIMTRKGFAKGSVENENSDQKSWITYIVPAAVQGIILVTFAYAIAGFLLDFYFYIMSFI